MVHGGHWWWKYISSCAFRRQLLKGTAWLIHRLTWNVGVSNMLSVQLCAPTLSAPALTPSLTTPAHTPSTPCSLLCVYTCIRTPLVPSCYLLVRASSQPKKNSSIHMINEHYHVNYWNYWTGSPDESISEEKNRSRPSNLIACSWSGLVNYTACPLLIDCHHRHALSFSPSASLWLHSLPHSNS